jgi:deoxyribonuclease-1
MKLMFLLLTMTSNAWSIDFESIPNYYGDEFKIAYSNNRLKDEDLKDTLFKIISWGHIKNENSADEIIPSCESHQLPVADFASVNEFSATQSKCVQHRSLGYETARKKLFGWMHLKQNERGEYFVHDVYCEKDFSDADFDGEKTFGPDLLPKSGNIINTEHTWPQSRFTGRFPRETQKSDLHHLYPTDSEMNARRGSLRFGFVAEEVEKTKCPQNKVGHQSAGGIIFEVPDAQKGNTARAIFYFATRYQMKISPPEEEALRVWNELDPVDDEERIRNDRIEEVQGNRNPFIDMPDLLKNINHF